MAASVDEILNQYSAPVDAAALAYRQAEERMNALQAKLDDIPEEDIGDGTGQRAAEAKALQTQLNNLQKTYGTAQQEYTQILHQRADAVTKAKDAADPAKQASLEAQAKADIARANQIDAESKEYVESAPDRRGAAKDASRLAKAKADEAEYGLQLARETDPAKKAVAQAALERAQADTARVVAETGQIGKAAPQTPEQARTAAAGATVAEATASNAQASSDTALSAAQTQQKIAEANLKRAEIDLANAPTSEEAKQAKATAQRGLEIANQAAEQALSQTSAEAPGRLAQQGATLESTQASTDASRATVDKAKMGDLYGMPDKIRQIRDLIASGEIKPADGDNMVAAAQRGTDIYSVMKQQAEEKSTQRGQDLSNKNALAGNFTSTLNSANNTFQEMNKTGAIGSDATGKAFLATLGLAQDYLKSYEIPAATPTDYLGTGAGGVGGMVNQAQQAIAAPPPVAPVAPPPAPVAPGGTTAPITINVGGGAAATPPPPAAPSGLLPVGMAGTPQDPRFAGASPPGSMPPASISGLVGQAAKAVPAGMSDIAAAFPGAAARHGLAGGM